MRALRLIAACMFAPMLALADCPGLYPVQPPQQHPNTTELCHSFYVVQYDNGLKGARLVSERVQNTQEPFDKPRNEPFKADPLNAHAIHNPNKDSFKGVGELGLSRGHMAPAGDAANLDQWKESYYMTNMTPQFDFLNSGPWNSLEENLRQRIRAGALPVHVVTVAAYGEGFLEGAAHIAIPASYLKMAFFDPQNPECSVADNQRNVEPDHAVRSVPCADVAERFGVTWLLPRALGKTP